MSNNVYNIVTAFDCSGMKMLVVRMRGATCIMSEADYNRIIIAERKYNQWKRWVA